MLSADMTVRRSGTTALWPSRFRASASGDKVRGPTKGLWSRRNLAIGAATGSVRVVSRQTQPSVSRLVQPREVTYPQVRQSYGTAALGGDRKFLTLAD